MRASILTRSSLILVAVMVVASLRRCVIGCGAKPKQVGEYPSENGAKARRSRTRRRRSGRARAASAAAEDAKPSRRRHRRDRRDRGASQRTDQYDKEATEVVIKRAARQVKENCGARRATTARRPARGARPRSRSSSEKNGHSKGVTVPAPYQGKPVGNCVEKAFTNLTFPPWGGSDTEVSWEVELVNPAEPARSSAPTSRRPISHDSCDMWPIARHDHLGARSSAPRSDGRHRRRPVHHAAA